MGEAGSGEALVDLQALDLTTALKELDIDDEQREIVREVFSRGSARQLAPEQLEKVKDIRATLGLKTVQGGETALIVRFDCQWVRIDEATNRLDLALDEFPERF